MTFAKMGEILLRSLGPDIAARACQAISREAAGESLYIPRRASPPEVLPTDTPRRLAAREGVSLSTAYVWLHRKRAENASGLTSGASFPDFP